MYFVDTVYVRAILLARAILARKQQADRNWLIFCARDFSAADRMTVWQVMDVLRLAI